MERNKPKCGPAEAVRIDSLSTGTEVKVYTFGPNQKRRVFLANIEDVAATKQENNPQVIVSYKPILIFEDNGPRMRKVDGLLSLGGGTAAVVMPQSPQPPKSFRKGNY